MPLCLAEEAVGMEGLCESSSIVPRQHRSSELLLKTRVKEADHHNIIAINSCGIFKRILSRISF
jgi:hypothetical protein